VAKGFDFPGEKVKTPTLPKAGRFGHPKDLNQLLSVDLLQRDYPIATFHQLKTRGRIGHSPAEGLATPKHGSMMIRWII